MRVFRDDVCFGLFCFVFVHRLRKMAFILRDDDRGHGEVGLVCGDCRTDLPTLSARSR